VRRLKSSFAPGLRHEVASALAVRQHQRRSYHEPTIHELLAEYLVMSHHGHVRKTLRDELPRDPGRVRREGDAVRGIREGTPIPAVSVDGRVLPATPALSIACRQMGRGPDGAESWTRSVLRLLDHFGPFRLAYYEAIVRSADCRASASPRTGVITAKPRSVTTAGEALVSGGAAR
jgi:CRISPR-associated endonuclease/helicase Cas3